MLIRILRLFIYLLVLIPIVITDDSVYKLSLYILKANVEVRLSIFM